MEQEKVTGHGCLQHGGLSQWVSEGRVREGGERCSVPGLGRVGLGRVGLGLASRLQIRVRIRTACSNTSMLV
jgi:hypothetical protein